MLGGNLCSLTVCVRACAGVYPKISGVEGVYPRRPLLSLFLPSPTPTPTSTTLCCCLCRSLCCLPLQFGLQGRGIRLVSGLHSALSLHGASLGLQLLLGLGPVQLALVTPCLKCFRKEGQVFGEKVMRVVKGWMEGEEKGKVVPD